MTWMEVPSPLIRRGFHGTTALSSIWLKPFTKNEPSTACRFWPTLWRKLVAPTPTFLPIAAALGRTSEDVGWSICCC